MNLLVVYPIYPEPDTNAGSQRFCEIIKILLARGLSVTLLAVEENDLKYRRALEAMGVRCAAYVKDGLRASTERFRAFLRQGAFDCAIFDHYTTYLECADYVRAFLPGCRRILDTVDLHFVRLEREARLSGDPAAQERAAEVRRQELRACRDAHQVWVVTEVERQVLGTEVPGKPVCVIPTIHTLLPETPGYSAREGIVFIGNYYHLPNVDAVNFFMKEVLPVVREALPEVPVTIAGSNPPAAFRQYAKNDARVSVTGFVEDHHAVLCSHRVGIAPLRFGAGMKGKIGEYICCGLPCVTTSIGAEGMGLEPGVNALIADDPAEFGKAVVRVYQDVGLWEKLSREGPDYVRRRYSPEAIAPAVLGAVCSAAPAHARSRKWAGLLLPAINPAKWVRLGVGSVKALRRGGLAELSSCIKVWGARQ
jgi:glycosyltransferase involved in cell wall biosynthesis